MTCPRLEKATFDKDFGDLVFQRGLPSGSAVVLFRILPEPRAVVEVIRSLIETGVLSAGRVLRCGARPGARSTAANSDIRLIPEASSFCRKFGSATMPSR